MCFQLQVLKAHCETVDGKVLTPTYLQWVGIVHPAPYCERYRMHLSYRTDSRYKARPVVTIQDPLLQKRGDKGCPHRYAEQEPCLYYPPSDEWTPSMLLAFTIVPWASRWLYFYEMWLATGEWLGGGIDHEPPE